MGKYSHAIAELNYWQLANMADCGSPDAEDSAGADFLRSVKGDVEEWVREMEDDEDNDTAERVAEAMRDDDRRSHEIADGAPDVYTHTRWKEFVDLQAYQEDISEYGDDGSDLTRTAGIALYMIAERLVNALIDFVEEQGDAEDEEAEEAEEDSAE